MTDSKRASTAAIDGDPRVGLVIDERYRILERMAEGSMGVVYRAERVPVGKAVAIKFLHAAFARHAEFAERFDRETHVLSKLAHPHCASVLDFGAFEGAPYLVMELIAGRTLRELLDDGPLPVSTALVLARQLATGLAHAHEQGIVHRDVKPANLMITEETGMGLHLWILDFGLARLRGAIGPGATSTHIVVGTPSYMAPEQTLGGTVDARADIYAAGVVIFEMVTGERPFRAEETADLLAMHRGAPVPDLAGLLSRRATLPAGLQSLVERAMAKDPGQRFQTAMELVDALDEVIALVPAATVLPRARTAAPAEAVKEASLDEAPASNESEDGLAEEVAPRARSHTRTVALLLILVGVAAGAWYVKYGRSSSTVSIASPAATSPAAKPKVATTPPKPAPPKPTPPKEAPPAAPALATSVPDAIQMIKEGKRELALTSLRALEKQSPKDAEIPFLLGNLNFDSGAFAIALDEYQRATTLGPSYRGNAVVDRNVIHLLGNARMRSQAIALLRGTIGRPAAPFLREAARGDRDPIVRTQAASVLRKLSSR